MELAFGRGFIYIDLENHRAYHAQIKQINLWTRSKEKKQLIAEFKQKLNNDFKNSLPIERRLLEKLFDYLDDKLSESYCDHTNKFTNEFLEKNKIENIQSVLSWLSENGGYCDCEILANVEEKIGVRRKSLKKYYRFMKFYTSKFAGMQSPETFSMLACLRDI